MHEMVSKYGSDELLSHLRKVLLSQVGSLAADPPLGTDLYWFLKCRKLCSFLGSAGIIFRSVTLLRSSKSWGYIHSFIHSVSVHGAPALCQFLLGSGNAGGKKFSSWHSGLAMRVSGDRNYPRNMNNYKTGQNKGKTKNKFIHWSTGNSQLWPTRSPAVPWAECCCWASGQGEEAQFFRSGWAEETDPSLGEVMAAVYATEDPGGDSQLDDTWQTCTGLPPWDTGSSLTFMNTEGSSPGKVKFQVKESTGHSKARSPQGPCTARTGITNMLPGREAERRDPRRPDP